SISWMTMRIILSGSSALSSIELMLELTISDSLENMLMGGSSLTSIYGVQDSILGTFVLSIIDHSRIAGPVEIQQLLTHRGAYPGRPIITAVSGCKNATAQNQCDYDKTDACCLFHGTPHVLW